MHTVFLAGGMGTRLSEETHKIPKPMIKIGKYPILFHIMKHYSDFNFNKFENSELPYQKPSSSWTPAEVEIVPRVKETSSLPRTITSKDVKLLESTDLFADDFEHENEKNELLEMEANERKRKIALLHEVNLCLVNRIDFKKV